MSNVILYESTTTDFFNQGLGPLTEAKDPKVTEVGNGEFYLELDYPTTGRLFNQLKNGNLIKSDAGHELKDQRFEIKRVVKSMKQGYVSVYAEHISNQALDIALPASVTLSGAAQTALQQAQNSALGTFKPFTMSSDITTTNSTTLSIKEFKNLKQALGGVEGSILDTWGGEYKFDNYHISLFKKRGRQANAMIAYGRNLVDLEQEENIMNTFTSVYPYAVWRDKEGAEHIIEGSVIHSEHADKYPHHKVLPVDFTLEVEDDTKPTPTILNQLATAYIENNDIGIPEVSIKLTHLDLSKTLDYKEYSEVEKLNVFDEVKIYFADFDINTTAKIVRTVWNVNLRRYDEIEVGKVRASLSDRINTIGKQISEARKEAQDARNVSMVAANGINMVFFGPDEPTATKVGDRWFMEDGQYTISKVWDGVIWRVVSDPRLSDQNAQLIGEQQAVLEEVKATADYSYDQLQQTIANSGFTDLDTAFGNVQTLSEQAESNAYNAMQKAIDNAGLIGGLDDSISSMSLEIDDINNSLTLKANATDIDRIDGTITDINNELTFQSGELSSKVSQTVYDADIGTIETTQTELTQTFEAFETSVIGPTGRLTLAEQFLDGFRNTAFDPSTGRLSLTEQTINGLQDTVSDPVNGLETRVTTLAGAYDLTVSKIATWSNVYSVNSSVAKPLTDINGNLLDTKKSYDIILGISGTNSVTYVSASLLSQYDSWNLVIHEENGTTSNQPRLFIGSNGYPQVTLYNHSSFYDVVATITETSGRQKSSMSAMYDQINLRVQEGDVYSQLLIDSRNILFDASDRIMLSANKLVIDASEGAFITSAIIESLSADKITAGTIDASQINVINLDASRITTGIIGGSAGNSWNMTTGLLQTVMEGTNTRAELNGGVIRSYSDRFGTAEINGGRIDFDDGTYRVGVNPLNLYFAKGNNIRNMYWQSEGLRIQPGPLNTGTDLNNSLYLTGITNAAHNYIQFEDPQYNHRIRQISSTLYIEHAVGGRVRLTDRNQGGGSLEIGWLSTSLTGSDYLQIGQNRIQTPRDGSRDIYLSPNGQGKIRVANVDHAYYPIRASAFENASSRKLKDNIETYTGNALDVINGLTVVEYELIVNMNDGIYDKQLGLIAEDSLSVATNDGESINTYRWTAYITKAVQELSTAHENVVTLASKAYLKAESNEERIERLESELKLLKGAS
ncbi:phage tail spike protein [Marinilactibacillus psychrotolerans]|uniref:phage tail spike protein n=1 Tax=Marinilactibacillus psychrotolerans TaxID=191770 RepID=UPI0039B116D7